MIDVTIPIENTGRRTGKTTRTVDLAVQKLFQHGEIYVPTKTEILQCVQGKVDAPRGVNKEILVIDPDWFHDKVQFILFDWILRRLKFEHQVEVKTNGARMFLVGDEYVKNGIHKS